MEEFSEGMPVYSPYVTGSTGGTNVMLDGKPEVVPLVYVSDAEVVVIDGEAYAKRYGMMTKVDEGQWFATKAEAYAEAIRMIERRRDAMDVLIAKLTEAQRSGGADE